MRNYLDLFSGSFKAISRRRLRLLALAGTLLGLCLPRAEANPQGGTVVQGSASFTTQGSQFNVTTSDRAFINWGSFNIAAGESTTFFQPSASSVVWNRIDGATPSQIFGNLQANGLVILQNQSGFFIGPHAVITANGLIMTTASSPPPDFSSAGPWSFNEPPPLASIINYGRINIGAGGSAFLIARDLENRGTITAPNGNIGLYAGKQVLVSERPDGRGLSAQVQLPEGSVDNSGNLIADAGTIALRAQVVNQGGLIQANSIRERNGVIELVASDALTLGPASTIEAKGDAQGTSAGGNILLKSDNAFNDQPTSTINVSGGAAGGHGGQVEISATKMDVIQSQIDGHATAGWLGGTLLIDPLNITLSSTGDAAGSGVVNAGDLPDTLTLNPNSFASFSQILLQAVNNITVASSWNLQCLGSRKDFCTQCKVIGFGPDYLLGDAGL
ncbi:MAG: Filamentous hemagglutinin family outer membrane protein [Pedosphaera sp.]|nr:Filamentous hemagglutinin family outer membrane protein [Pedosphaera sp.]